MSTVTIEAAPVVQLSNGLRVANFSSPHEFNFADGSVLPACSTERCKALSLHRDEKEEMWAGERPQPLPLRPPLKSVSLTFATTAKVREELGELEMCWDVDIVLIPFPVLQSLRDEKLLDRFKKVGTVIAADRVTKAAHIDRFGR